MTPVWVSHMHGLKLCAKRLWLPLNEGDIGEAAELVQTGLVGTYADMLSSAVTSPPMWRVLARFALNSSTIGRNHDQGSNEEVGQISFTRHRIASNLQYAIY